MHVCVCAPTRLDVYASGGVYVCACAYTSDMVISLCQLEANGRSKAAIDVRSTFERSFSTNFDFSLGIIERIRNIRYQLQMHANAHMHIRWSCSTNWLIFSVNFHYSFLLSSQRQQWPHQQKVRIRTKEN